MKNKKYLPSAFVLYLTYFVHGIGCSVLGQAVIKESLAAQWGYSDLAAGIGAVTMVSASLGLGRLITLPFSGPLSDKLGRRPSTIIGILCYAIFFFGIAFSPNMTFAYVAAIFGGAANSFLDTGVIPACVEILEPRSSLATMGTKFFISVAQLLLPFMLGFIAANNMSYNMILIVTGIAILVVGVLTLFAPLPKQEKSNDGQKQPGLIENIKHSKFTIESIALIIIGFTCTATFQLWLNCAQTFAKDLAGMADPSIMQTYYSSGSLLAIVVTAILVNKIKGVRFLLVYPAITLVTLIAVLMFPSQGLCLAGAAIVGYSAGAVILQLVTATCNDLFPKIKGTITSIVMIMSSLSNYTILTLAGTMDSSSIMMMNIVITAIGVLLALFVNMRYSRLVGSDN
ncbi:MFS transporter [uncultured Faecalicoccus sp.]|uniref:MFS transporter n=1 Tax=uncultured Faecalicoccus sp. TaxID=1971760 RepID=UPI002610A922|nr:MFS transporter [uncultured Faecalicoccus sp.]